MVWVGIGIAAAITVLAVIFWGGEKGVDFLGRANDTETESAVQKNELSGISPIRNGQVIAPSGAVADNSAAPGAENAPQQSGVVSENAVPPSAIKLSASAGGFSPNTFEVRSGSIVTLAVMSEDSSSYIFAFEHPELSAATVGVGPGQTRVINFKAPAVGTYDFRSAVPGHAAKGLTGKMIVK